MNMKKCSFTIVLIFLKMITVQSSDINLTLYYTFPPLYDYENYDHCLHENPSKISAYCLTDIELIPNNQSELWKNIEEFSRDKNRHFRHDSMIYGICVNWCENTLKDLSDLKRQNLNVGGILRNKKLVEYIEDLYPKETANRIKYNKIINECLNLKFKSKYNLTVSSNIKYCNTNKDKLEIESLDILFAIVTILIIALNVLSSFYDLLLKKKLPSSLQTNQHYKEAIKNPQQQLLLSFSVSRNYFRLTKKSYETSNHVKDLRYLDTWKFFMMLGVIASHLMEFQIVAGLQNTEHLENFLHRFDKNILVNASALMQCFFQISGFLVMLAFDDYISKMKKDQIRYIPLFLKMVISRYIRLIPLMAYGVLFSSSILFKLGKGPLWRLAAEREKVFCRRNWWINLLFLQNYIDVGRSCIPQSWYVAVDIQSFIVCGIIMLLCYKYSHKVKVILGVAIILAMIFPAITVYVYDVPGLYFHVPEYFRHFVYFNDEFKKMYIPMHNNIMGYLFGIITGKLFLYFKSINFKISESKFRVFIWYALIPFGFALIFTGEIYYRFNVPKIISAIHAGFYKLIYANIFLYLLIGIADKIGWMAYAFSSLPMFRILGRLTYSVLIVHLYVTLSVFALVRTPQYQSDMRLILYAMGVIALSYVIAFLITLLLELPTSAVLKLMFGRKNQSNNRLLKEKNQLQRSQNSKDDQDSL